MTIDNQNNKNEISSDLHNKNQESNKQTTLTDEKSSSAPKQPHMDSEKDSSTDKKPLVHDNNPINKHAST